MIEVGAMIIGRIKGCTRTLGEAQGYIPLPVRDSDDNGSPIMETAWFPTPTEIDAITRGMPVLLTLHGRQHPPVRLGVGNQDDVGYFDESNRYFYAGLLDIFGVELGDRGAKGYARAMGECGRFQDLTFPQAESDWPDAHSVGIYRDATFPTAVSVLKLNPVLRLPKGNSALLTKVHHVWI